MQYTAAGIWPGMHFVGFIWWLLAPIADKCDEFYNVIVNHSDTLGEFYATISLNIIVLRSTHDSYSRMGKALVMDHFNIISPTVISTKFNLLPSHMSIRVHVFLK